MSTQFLSTALFATLVASSLCAQTRYIPDSVVGGGCNVIPFGTNTTSSTWSNQRYQTMATFADLGSPAGPVVICNLGFLSCGTTDNISHSDTIEIRLAQTNATALSATFATNLATNVQTVLKRTNFDWHQKGGVWERIGLDKSYLFIPSQGRNLIIDICVTGNRKLLGGTTGFRTGSRQRLFSFGWTGTTCPPTGTLQTAALKWCVDLNSWGLAHQGVGCQNLKLELSGSAQLGQTLQIAQTGLVRLGSICFLAIGAGSLSTPFDLGIVGAKGCSVYTVPLVTVPYRGAFKTTVPNDRNLICQNLVTQIYCLNQGYPGGIATTNSGVIVPGIAR